MINEHMGEIHTLQNKYKSDLEAMKLYMKNDYEHLRAEYIELKNS